ncbi:hypothetical protein RE6C_02405 [Rhodopirellula europaea 6C]|uniref:Uncharacterized protein n=1 Tax=Rhodopirellula europaea 6C TaxID=1263867 RepID=M2AVM8_9BACT|nr:hypothetical protein RE6C_02405 [Rhodopirellula europaea 6C]
MCFAKPLNSIAIEVSPTRATVTSDTYGRGDALESAICVASEPTVQ